MDVRTHIGISTDDNEKKYFNRLMIVASIVFVVTFIITISSNYIVNKNSDGKIYDSLDAIKPAEVGLLLGTTPQTRIGGRKNMFFKYRIDAAEELYNAGKLKYILISGDESSLDGINEPECMKDSLVARGIPVNVIFLDGKEFRT